MADQNIFAGIETPLEAQDRLKKQYLLQQQQQQSSQGHAGVAMGAALRNVIERFKSGDKGGGFFHRLATGEPNPEVAQARDAQSVLSSGQKDYQAAVAAGQDPMKAQADMYQRYALDFAALGRGDAASQMQAMASQLQSQWEVRQAELDKLRAEAEHLRRSGSGQANPPGSLQELDRINQERTAKGLEPIPAEQYLIDIRGGTSAARQAYTAYVRNEAEAGRTPMAFDDFSVQFGGQQKAAETLGSKGMERFDSMFNDARSARRGIDQTIQAQQLLNAGMRTGAAAGTRQAFARVLDTMGGRQTDMDSLTANTDAYVASAGRAVAEQIKAFGAGTGLSDADREYARQIAGGELAMTEGALRKILEMHHKAYVKQIADYNASYSRLAGKYDDVKYLYGTLDAPELPAAPAAPAGRSTEDLLNKYAPAVR